MKTLKLTISLHKLGLSWKTSLRIALYGMDAIIDILDETER